MSASRDEMLDVIKAQIAPVLKDRGFAGTGLHYRRLRDGQLDLLMFQFNRYGGSFVVEVGWCAPEGITTHWGEKVPPHKVTPIYANHDVRLRLGASGAASDHWFVYGPAPVAPGVCRRLAEEILSLVESQGETWWRTHTLV